MRVAAFQFDVKKGDVAHNLREVEAGLRAAAKAGVQLVCLPEMWPTAFDPAGDSADNVAAVERARELSAELALVVCGSAFASVGESRPRNRLHVFAEGASLLTYDKVHLFSPTAERELFSSGDLPPDTVDGPLGRISGLVCYDLRFGELLGVAVRAGAEVLVVPAQWPTPREAHWRALVRGRAVEAQAFVVAANRTGVDTVGRGERELAFPGNSLIVDANGDVLAEGRGEAGLVVADLDPDALRLLRRQVPVGRDRRSELYRRWK